MNKADWIPHNKPNEEPDPMIGEEIFYSPNKPLNAKYTEDIMNTFSNLSQNNDELNCT
jgi:hypothetical protein